MLHGLVAEVARDGGDAIGFGDRELGDRLEGGVLADECDIGAVKSGDDAERLAAEAETLAAEGTPMDDHRASARYRAAMLEQSLQRFYAEHGTADQMEVAR